MKSFIQKLVECSAPSGFEKPVRDIILNEVQSYADSWRIDPLGNLIMQKGQKTAQGKRILLAAHMDEIGIMASFIDENGFIRFTNIGGVFPINCVNGRVRFLNGVPGVIGMEKLEKPGVPELSQLYIDVGATSRKDCPIKIGDPAVFERPMVDFGDRLVSKAMDDRISVAVLAEVLKKTSETPHEIFFVFSVQEELGTRGAMTAAYDIDPEIGISVDVTRTGDTPRGVKMEVSLGKGPAIKIRDSGMISDPRLVRALVSTAESASLPYQLEVLEAGTTDARAIQVTRAGVPSGCISIPCRYVHSPSEMVSYSDVLNSVSLLAEFISRPVTL